MRARTRIVSAAALPLAALAIVLAAEQGGHAWIQRAARAPVLPPDVRALSPPDVRAPSARDGDVTGNHAAFTERTADAWAAALERGRVVIGELEFTGDSDTLAPSAGAVLERLARTLNAARGTFLVEAHAAPRGDVVAEQLLTDRRAAAVRERLVAAGVSAARLFAMGFGATRPARDAGHALTSRIEISRMP